MTRRRRKKYRNRSLRAKSIEKGLSRSEQKASENGLSEQKVSKTVSPSSRSRAQVRTSCGGALVAADSSLSRPFRANGNYYCGVRAAGSPDSCEATVDACEGSIARLARSDAADAWPANVDALPMRGRPRRAARAGVADDPSGPPLGAAAATTRVPLGATAAALAVGVWLLRGRSRAAGDLVELEVEHADGS